MCTVRDCISKGVSFMLPIVDYYLKELCNTIIKFKGMFACYRCLVAPYNHLDVQLFIAIDYSLSDKKPLIHLKDFPSIL